MTLANVRTYLGQAVVWAALAAVPFAAAALPTRGTAPTRAPARDAGEVAAYRAELRACGHTPAEVEALAEHHFQALAAE